MKHKLLIGVIGIVFGCHGMVRGQYSLLAYEPPLSFTHLDLWHLSIAGPVDTNMTEFHLRLRVLDDQSTLLLKSQSADFELLTTSLYINTSNLSSIQPITTSYTIDNVFQAIANSGGYFPAGNYLVNFTLWGRPSDGEFEELAIYDYPITVELLWPPMLISVENEDTICEPYPVFTWIPAYQQIGTDPLTYAFKLVEVNSFQTSYQAMTANPSYYEETNIPITMLNYPPFANQLIQGSSYAWGVDAMINGQVAASSEIWSFVYSCPMDTIIDSVHFKPYVKLRSETDGGVAKLTDKFLRICYEERYAQEEEASLEYRIIKAAENEVIQNSPIQLSRKQGSNFYIISVCGEGLDLEDGQYYFEVTDQSGIRWYMQFSKQQISCN